MLLFFQRQEYQLSVFTMQVGLLGGDPNSDAFPFYFLSPQLAAMWSSQYPACLKEYKDSTHLNSNSNQGVIGEDGEKETSR